MLFLLLPFLRKNYSAFPSHPWNRRTRTLSMRIPPPPRISDKFALLQQINAAEQLAAYFIRRLLKY